MPDAPAKPVTALYAFLGTCPDSPDEYLISGTFAPGADGKLSFWPLTTHDPDRLEPLKALAKESATRTGTLIRLVRFTTREELETIR